MDSRNKCDTYFKITGDFDPDVVSEMLGLTPEKQWRIGDKRRGGRSEFEFASWKIGLCSEYDVIVENQMHHTIRPLLPKIETLKEIKQKFNVYFTLEIVPWLFAGEIAPCLAPSKEVIRFCYETDTSIDIDLYLFNSTDGDEIIQE
ncbi:MAG TPA: DUF4279 domain-containing protein [Feifaniaceae bacterium]|nr:DUF4279 domain-containing protein [Feifaniaceae bacterium]